VVTIHGVPLDQRNIVDAAHQVHAGYLSKLDIGTARGGAATKRLAELINPLHL